MKLEIDNDKFGTLCICALRYCFGRQTYMPDLVRGVVRGVLKDLDDTILEVMIDDAEFQRNMGLYGDEKIDKPGWIKWEQELKEEKGRRKNAK